MLFGIPLLFTMEVWWVGGRTTPQLLYGVLAAMFVVVYLLNRTSGFRSTVDVRVADVLKDTVESLAIALVCAFGVLVLIREINLGTPVQDGLGKVVYEAAPFSIGVGLARHFLRGDGDDPDASQRGDGDPEETTINATVADVGATLLGALFVAFNIAPTDEIPMITAALSPWWLLAMVATALVVSYGIVFTAGFSSQQSRHEQQGAIQHPVTETLVCYLLALVSAAAMLWFFQRWSLDDPFDVVLQQAVVLSLPATIGGSAGRLAV
jgi:putative integral membrane protein (TIGR02587 family)